MLRKDTIKNPGLSSNTVGHDATLVGNLDVPGSLQVLGRVIGSVQVRDSVYVGPAAVIEGDVRARSARVEGEVYGNLTAREGVDLMTGARLTGDVVARFFRIEDGAVFKGQCHMGDRGFDDDDER